ncbi:hypothetical protein R6Q59_001702 [Mikania micrantha]
MIPRLTIPESNEFEQRNIRVYKQLGLDLGDGIRIKWNWILQRNAPQPTSLAVSHSDWEWNGPEFEPLKKSFFSDKNLLRKFFCHKLLPNCDKIPTKTKTALITATAPQAIIFLSIHVHHHQPPQAINSPRRAPPQPTTLIRSQPASVCATVALLKLRSPRNIHFLGFDGQQKVTRSYGVVISLRGVGTHPATKGYSEGYLIIGSVNRHPSLIDGWLRQLMCDEANYIHAYFITVSKMYVHCDTVMMIHDLEIQMEAERRSRLEMEEEIRKERHERHEIQLQMKEFMKFRQCPTS